MIRAVIVSGSAFAASQIEDVLALDPELSVVRSEFSGLAALDAVRRLKPDVVVMDIRPTGHAAALDTTRRIMIEAPTPIVLAADPENAAGAGVAMLALQAGALTMLSLPKGSPKRDLPARVQEFASYIKAMSQVKVVRQWARTSAAKFAAPAAPNSNYKIVAIAASTGGPAALQRILAELPVAFPVPVVIVQHIVSGFVGSLVDWLQASCKLHIALASDGDTLKRQTVYVAPDGRHLGIERRSKIVLSDAPSMNGFKPSANYLFQSVASCFGPDAIGVILTGMGQDGVDGMRALHRAGGHAIAQDEATSIVFGMPGAAIAARVIDDVLPLNQISGKLVDLVAGTMRNTNIDP